MAHFSFLDAILPSHACLLPHTKSQVSHRCRLHITAVARCWEEMSLVLSCKRLRCPGTGSGRRRCIAIWSNDQFNECPQRAKQQGIVIQKSRLRKPNNAALDPQTQVGRAGLFELSPPPCSFRTRRKAASGPGSCYLAVFCLLGCTLIRAFAKQPHLPTTGGTAHAKDLAHARLHWHAAQAHRGLSQCLTTQPRQQRTPGPRSSLHLLSSLAASQWIKRKKNGNHRSANWLAYMRAAFAAPCWTCINGAMAFQALPRCHQHRTFESFSGTLELVVGSAEWPNIREPSL